MARVKDVEPRSADENDLIAQAKEYAFTKQQMEYWEKKQKELKTQLFERLDNEGEVDSKGNLVIELPTEVEGFVALVKQRRVTRKIDELAADALIESKGLEDKLYKTIRVVDEDALMAALYNDELTEAEVDEMYPQSVVWALVMNKK